MASNNQTNYKMASCLTIDVEEWFHILDSPAVPAFQSWSSLESRIERNLDKLLHLLESHSVKATFFWLGWLAERQKHLVRKCQSAGHEIASHGYAHVLPYKVGPAKFKEDICRAKDILEEITGEAVRGFRAPGFGITKEAPWAFALISDTGYQYDSSVFPAARGHGGISESPLGPYFIETTNGHLLEIPMSIIEIFNKRTSLFGGGYLRLASKHMIKWGISKLRLSAQPLIVYIHPREIDPEHPRLPLSPIRQFKSYINLNSTMPKLKWLCKEYSFCTLLEMIENYIKSFYLESKTIPVVRLENNHRTAVSLPAFKRPAGLTDNSFFRNRLLLLEEAMAGFLNPGAFNRHSTIQDQKFYKTTT